MPASMRFRCALGAAIVTTLAPAMGDTCFDDFSQGLRHQLWTVVQTTPGQFGWDDSNGDVRFFRVSPTTPGGLQAITARLNLGRFGGPVAGDFAAQVDFRDANVLLTGLNQVELHTEFSDGKYLFVVYDNDNGSNLNFHVWDGAYHNQIHTSATSGTMRITRVGSVVTGFVGGTPIFSIQDSSDLTSLHLVLQNNAGSSAPISVTFDNFQMTATNRCPADFDADGSVDFFDYDAFVTCFEGGACPAGKTADFDDDGAVDFFDYDAFVVAFEAGC